MPFSTLGVTHCLRPHRTSRLAPAVPHASELFYHVAPVIEFHEDDASASVPELDCAQPPIASPHAHFT